MKKIIMFLIMAFSVFGYTLIDSEDFESYIVGDHTTSDFITNNPKWNCTTSSAYPTCDRILAGTGTGAGGWAIIENTISDSKELVIYSLGGVNNNYRVTSLKWDSSNSPTPVNNDDAYVIKFKARIVEEDYSGFTGSGLLKPSWRIQASPLNFYGLNQYLYYGIGATLNVSMHDRLRIMYQTDRQYPEDTACILSSGNKMSNVVIQHYYNSSTAGYLDNTKVFIDGVECMNYENPQAQAGYGVIYDILYFQAIGGYSLAIDDLELYYGEFSESEILADYFQDNIIDCPYQNCIYYDNFDYEYLYNISNLGYVYSDVTESGNMVYIGDYIQNDIQPYDYSQITNLFFMNIDEEVTPLFNDNLLIYSFQDYCINGYKVSDVYFLFDRPENKTGILQDQQTQVYIYVKNPYGGTGDLQLDSLGSLILNNGESIGFTRYYDFESNKFSIVLNYISNDFNGVQTISNRFEFNFNAVCDGIDYFKIQKIGSSNETEFIGIDEIVYYGSNINEALADIPQDIIDSTTMENQETALKSVAYSMGFKDSNGMTVFWFGVIVVGLFFVLSSNIPPEGKTIGSIIIVSIGIIAGYIWGFLDLKYIIIMIFLIGLSVAYLVNKTINGQSA